MVNLLVRHGLPLEAERELSVQHEGGHLQVLPLALLATVVLVLRAWRTRSIRWRVLPLLWAGHHALWEMLAESYVMWSRRMRYKRLYAGRLHGGLLLFWLVTTGLLAWSLRVTGQKAKRAR